jgi:hypothetical protein
LNADHAAVSRCGWDRVLGLWLSRSLPFVVSYLPCNLLLWNGEEYVATMTKAGGSIIEDSGVSLSQVKDLLNKQK